MPYAISVYILQPRRDLEFLFRKVDLPKDSSEKCKKRVFEAVSMVEVIKLSGESTAYIAPDQVVVER